MYNIFINIYIFFLIILTIIYLFLFLIILSVIYSLKIRVFLLEYLIQYWERKYPIFDYDIVRINSRIFMFEVFLYPNNIFLTNYLLLACIFHTLRRIPEFKDLGEYKVILLAGYSQEQWFTIGKSYVIGPNTLIEDIINHYKISLEVLANRAYPIDNFNIISIKIGSKILDYSNESIENSKNKFRNKSILPLKSVKQLNNRLGVIDIETLEFINKVVAYAVGYRLLIPNNKTLTRLFYLSDYGNENNILEASNNMIKAFVKDFIKDAKDYHIYIHNLGEFDGYLLLKVFYEVLGDYDILIDKSKTIISMDLPGNIRIRDSLRILTSSLKDLSNMFKVTTPKGYFNHKDVTIYKIYKDKNFRIILQDYLSKDLISLLDVIISASLYIYTNYKVDLSNSYSTASLAIQIFRTKFQDKSIPLLAKHVDTFVRKSYRGGATEVYRSTGENLYYYDVNSLYPFVIKNNIPFEFLGIKNKPELDNFFGFVYAKIVVPYSVKTPVLPWQNLKTGEIIYPRGVFIGYYFSEELKAVIKLGYKIQCYIGYEFSQEVLFNNYVDHFYEAKSKAKDSERFLIKLLLNGLYGYFGRTLDKWNVEILPTENAINKLFDYYGYELIELDDKYSIIVLDNIPSKELLELQGKSYHDYIQKNRSSNNYNTVLTNVAIASAISSYARIHIIPVKTNVNNECLYSDTDSVFLQHKLPSELVGPNLGQFKDELNGDMITEAIFLNKKVYGYKTSGYSKVVIAGVPTIIIPEHIIILNGKERLINKYKTSVISYEELKSIKNGGVIYVKRRDIITKSLQNLSLRIVENTLKIKLNLDTSKTPVFNNKKELIGYDAPYIVNLSKFAILERIYYKSKNNIKKLIKNIKILSKKIYTPFRKYKYK